MGLTLASPGSVPAPLATFLCKGDLRLCACTPPPGTASDALFEGLAEDPQLVAFAKHFILPGDGSLAFPSFCGRCVQGCLPASSLDLLPTLLRLWPVLEDEAADPAVLSHRLDSSFLWNVLFLEEFMRGLAAFRAAVDGAPTSSGAATLHGCRLVHCLPWLR